jgi:outer membrane protein OmpA-like peptidoglycan-associated protein
MLTAASYYYIDDVIVQRQVEFIPDVPVIADEEIFESDSVITLRNVQFAYNSAVLVKQSIPELQSVLTFLKKNAAARLEIEGHTDDLGSTAYNQELSVRRALAVRQFLIEGGIAPARLIATGYGKMRPIMDQTDEPARALNRRVEVKLLR